MAVISTAGSSLQSRSDEEIFRNPISGPDQIILWLPYILICTAAFFNRNYERHTHTKCDSLLGMYTTDTVRCRFTEIIQHSAWDDVIVGTYAIYPVRDSCVRPKNTSAFALGNKLPACEAATGAKLPLRIDRVKVTCFRRLNFESTEQVALTRDMV